MPGIHRAEVDGEEGILPAGLLHAGETMKLNFQIFPFDPIEESPESKLLRLRSEYFQHLKQVNEHIDEMGRIAAEIVILEELVL